MLVFTEFVPLIELKYKICNKCQSSDEKMPINMTRRHVRIGNL